MELRTRPTVADGLTIQETRGTTHLVLYEPGNGTAYTLLITNLTPFGFSREAHHRLGLSKGSGGFVVAWPGMSYRTLMYSAGSYLDPSWFQTKVGCTLADAVVLCELLAYLTDCTAQTCEEYRRYHNG